MNSKVTRSGPPQQWIEGVFFSCRCGDCTGSQDHFVCNSDHVLTPGYSVLVQEFEPAPAFGDFALQAGAGMAADQTELQTTIFQSVCPRKPP